jgi:hypothetical protein
MPAPVAVRELIERYESQRDSYRSDQYNEAQLRREFLEPFFEALGWDVYNRKGYAEAYKEVIHEDAIRVGGRMKAPDSCFRAGGGTRNFFVEAKRPAIDIEQAAAHAFQLRRYGWTAKLLASLLSNFEQTAVYDCRIRPKKTDKPAAARIMLLRYTEYAERWDELSDLFSPEAVRRGSLEKLVASTKIKKGTVEVDTAFLQEIELWRDVLAHNIALRNPGISDRDLNFAVQRTIDRIVFLRICEDRGIELYGRLQDLCNAPNIYRRLAELFQRADERYNSGLFYFDGERNRAEPPDEMTLGLAIDDKPLRDILEGLYYPESPYEFSVLPAEILGQVYEQFLGKVIRVTKGGQARVDEKPEVRKAGGVYYTPAYVVDYIVRNTVGSLLAGRSPAAAARLRVLDPACGSGSFLIGAYQYLLDWHRDWYVEHGAERRARGRNPVLYRGGGGQWRLTAAEKKRILLRNIFGVDIDAQAVEVTKLALLLKVLEYESDETVSNQLRLYHERALPDLGANIKCGNSLIGPDFYNGRQLSLLDDEERYRINAFDWKTEFPEILKAGGFDAVIGNPPYGADADDSQLGYYRRSYETAAGSCDSFALFIEQASNLLRATGRFGMIVQSACVSSPSMRRLREMFIGRFKPLSFASMPYDVFAAYVDTVVIIAERLRRAQSLRSLASAPVELTVFPPRFKVASVDDFSAFTKSADAVKWLSEASNEFLVTLSDRERRVIDKLRKAGARFCDVADIQRGVTPFQVEQKKPARNPARAFTGTVRRYRLASGPRGYIRYDETLAEYKPLRYFSGHRILLREMISRQFRLQAACVAKDFVTNKSMQSVLLAAPNYHLFYLLGILNSRLMSWYFLAVHSVGRRDDFPKIVLKQTRELPFRAVDFSDGTEKSRHDRMVQLVGAMLALGQRLSAARAGHEKTLIQRQIDATDRQIDRAVYELYGLTDKEVAIIEQAAP